MGWTISHHAFSLVWIMGLQRRPWRRILLMSICFWAPPRYHLFHLQRAPLYVSCTFGKPKLCSFNVVLQLFSSWVQEHAGKSQCSSCSISHSTKANKLHHTRQAKKFGGRGKEEKCKERTLPNELRGEMGVWKKMTEDTMTTTRFRQFPTECVTADTISSIIYETCHAHPHPQKKPRKTSISGRSYVWLPY